MAARVLIAGAGVAALEAVLALNALATGRVEVELLGPEHHFWYRPLSVAEPFELGEAKRYELPELAVAAGARFTPGTLLGVDPVRRAALTSVGDIPYDFLLVAVGATPCPAVPGAVTFRGPADREKIVRLLDEIKAGVVRRVAFAVPDGPVWPLPLYELALLTAAHATANRIAGVELTLATPEAAPLEAFGREGSAEVRRLLEERAIALRCRASPIEFVGGVLRLAPDGTIETDRVVVLPRLRGAKLHGLPQTPAGFVPTDEYGRVRGLNDVYAAGDVVDFSLKHGGIATQLADAAARSIASRVGADVELEPFRPELSGSLLTGGRPRFLRTEPADVAESVPALPPAKIAGRYLTPFLASLGGVETPA